MILFGVSIAVVVVVDVVKEVTAYGMVILLDDVIIGAVFIEEMKVEVVRLDIDAVAAWGSCAVIVDVEAGVEIATVGDD